MRERLREACGLLDPAFWPDDVSLRDDGLFNFAKVQGHHQIPDLYLLGLAVRLGGCLVSFDQAISVTSVVGATPKHLVLLQARAAYCASLVLRQNQHLSRRPSPQRAPEGQRQQAHPLAHARAGGIHRHQRAGLQLFGTPRQPTDDLRADTSGAQTAGSDLHDARLCATGGGKDVAKIEVVSEHNAIVLARKLHDVSICGRPGPNSRPMHGVMPGNPQNIDPTGRQVRVDEQRHAAASGSSLSSERQAA